ncbi:MAG TPA: iron chelate uptake ABC transporter family permease subunit [Patescibacteria group bacterium]|nr:iron chelate uptake ABC transporter family permease subunit [Patescibacteria group bacterium]
MDPNFRYSVLGAMLLGAGAAAIGCFAFLKKQSLVGDAVAHAVLPGICVGFLLAGTKSTLALFAGALVTGWLSLEAIRIIRQRTRLKEDAAIAIVLSVFFGAGILLLTMIQHSDNAQQAGLDKFLFGKAASLVEEDVQIFAVMTAIIFVLLYLFYKEFKIAAFDPQFSKSIGLPMRLIDFLQMALIVVAVVAGIQAVGVVLMAAMLITPAATARYWTNSLPKMIGLAVSMGVVAAVAGVAFSTVAPKIPTGPSIVLAATFLFAASLVLAPERGVMARAARHRRNYIRMQDENVLKTLYHLGEESGDFLKSWTEKEILARRKMPPVFLKNSLRRLRRQGFLKESAGAWTLTPEGKRRGARVTKLHRLWEVYLTKYVNIAHDHVHDDAENMEHVLTPELEERLEQLLEFPGTDPHDKTIPY